MKQHLNRLIQRIVDFPPEKRGHKALEMLALLRGCASSVRIQINIGVFRAYARRIRVMTKLQNRKLGSRAVQALSGFLAGLHIRHRYLLTRDNRLRLRYAVPCLMVAIFMLMAGFGGVVLQSGTNALGGSLAFTEEQTLAEDNLAAMQKRLQRYQYTQNDLQVIPAPKKKPQAVAREKVVEIGKGDTLAGVLQRAGLDSREAYKAVLAMEDHYDPRKIRPGQKIKARFDPVDETGSDYKFIELEVSIDPIRTVSLTRSEDQFSASIIEKEVVPKVYAGKADIEVSLYGSAMKAGIPASVIANTMHIFSWDVDFQRDIRQGDLIEVMYEQLETPEGVRVKSGEIIYARLNVNGDDIPVYRYELKDGDVDYFTADGASVRKALMKTPIDGARLSSGFGMRRHPVLGYNKMHKGVDFAAPRGTPIYAAGDGTVERAGPFSSYGNYIRIRHNASLKTAYAHLKGFAKGVSTGKRVKQGQVIGYVGTTGRSTGPHLHYEVLKNNKQVNPNSIKLPQGEVLTGSALSNFKKHVEKINRQYASLSGNTKLAALR